MVARILKLDREATRAVENCVADESAMIAELLGIEELSTGLATRGRVIGKHAVIGFPIVIAWVNRDLT